MNHEVFLFLEHSNDSYFSQMPGEALLDELLGSKTGSNVLLALSEPVLRTGATLLLPLSQIPR